MQTRVPVKANEEIFIRAEFAPIRSFTGPTGPIVKPALVDVERECLQHAVDVLEQCARLWRGTALSVSTALIAAVLYIWLK